MEVPSASGNQFHRFNIACSCLLLLGIRLSGFRALRSWFLKGLEALEWFRALEFVKWGSDSKAISLIETGMERSIPRGCFGFNGLRGAKVFRIEGM